MSPSAKPSWWADALRLKDEMSLLDLSTRLGVGVGELTQAFREAGVAKRRAPAAGDEPSHARPVGADDRPVTRRPGSKDVAIEAHLELLGKVPDAEIAKRAKVSVRTVASYRARHHIPGYKGPRRPPSRSKARKSKLDAFRDLIGTVPDRVVAERAGMSLGAVRNYRVKHGIRASGRRGGDTTAGGSDPLAEITGRRAWRITLRVGGGSERDYLVVAEDLVDAAQRATEAAERVGADIVRIAYVNEILD